MPIKSIRTSVLLLVMLILPLLLLAQPKTAYSVKLAGKKIGEITISKIHNGNIDTIEVNSEVNFKVLWSKYFRQTTSIVTFKNNGLTSSYTNIRLDHELEDSTALILTKNKYQGYRYPNEQVELADLSISYSSVKLYFEEPVGKSEIFSERFLANCPIKVIGEGKYRLYLPNGKQNTYTYVNGELIEVFVDRTWFNIRFCKED